MIQALITISITAALAEQKQRLRTSFAAELEVVRNHVSSLTVQAPHVLVYKRVVPSTYLT